MSAPDVRVAGRSSEAETKAENAAPSYRIVNRVLDWITSEKTQLLNITDRINDVVRRSGIRNGLVHLQSLHTTTALILTEWQDALIEDAKRFLEELADPDRYYKHNDPEHSDCDRQNAPSHLRGMIMGQTLCLQVRNAKLLLGTWQSIVLAELDGPRNRSLAVQVSGV